MTVLTKDLTWVEYDEKVRLNPVVFLTVGSHEQHGPHLPMCCDVEIPDRIAQAVADNVGGLVVPPIVFGYKSQARSGGGNHIPGTISLDAASLIGTVKDIVCELGCHGVRRIVIMDGHYENTMFIIEGVDLALRDLRRDGISDIKVLRIGYYEFTTPEAERVVWPDGFPSWPLEHAGVMETSVMMYLCPDMVYPDRIPDHGPAEFPPYDVYPQTWENLPGLPKSGALISARSASPEKGKLLFDTYVSGISEAVRKEFGLT
ncbi:creatininase [Brucella pituitosa]|uniref:creatininase n=1 Tax=Brucella pituitosa TaxID=571256 RepID=UPI0020057B2A|nr:creatininase [Brucella pituitosa]